MPIGTWVGSGAGVAVGAGVTVARSGVNVGSFVGVGSIAGASTQPVVRTNVTSVATTVRSQVLLFDKRTWAGELLDLQSHRDTPREEQTVE